MLEKQRTRCRSGKHEQDRRHSPLPSWVGSMLVVNMCPQADKTDGVYKPGDSGEEVQERRQYAVSILRLWCHRSDYLIGSA